MTAEEVLKQAEEYVNNHLNELFGNDLKMTGD